jgi:hypothetical protein
MVVEGIPSELRATRKIVGRKTGDVEIPDIDESSRTFVGSISLPRRKRDLVEFHILDGVEGLCMSEGRLDGRSFSADSNLSVMSSLREKVENEVNRYSQPELRKGWYPHACALAITRHLRQGMRSLYEIVREQYTTLDWDEVIERHERHGREIAERYVACGGGLYSRAPSPFVFVKLGNRVEVSFAIGSEAGQIADAVAVFAITDVDDAVEYAGELAERYTRPLSVEEHSLSVERSEWFEIDRDCMQTRLVGNAMMAAFRGAVSRMGAEEVALRLPIPELELARSLGANLSVTSASQDDLEAAIDACLEFSRGAYANPFLPRNDEVADTLLRDWRSRNIGILPLKDASVRRPGFL